MIGGQTRFSTSTRPRLVRLHSATPDEPGKHFGQRGTPTGQRVSGNPGVGRQRRRKGSPSAMSPSAIWSRFGYGDTATGTRWHGYRRLDRHGRRGVGDVRRGVGDVVYSCRVDHRAGPEV